MTPERWLLVDGTNAFFRSYVVVPETDANGEPVGGCMGTIRSLRLMLEMFSPSRVLFFWDGPGGSGKRRSIMSQYKMGRKPRLNRAYDPDEGAEPGARNMTWQMGKAREYLALLGICQVEVACIEADDAIAYAARHVSPEIEKVIVSSDKDFLQLADDRTRVYSPTKKRLYGAADVLEETGVLPSNYVCLRAMCGAGDASDNIHGIKGLGRKTALKLFAFLAEREVTLADVLDWAKAMACVDGTSRFYRLVDEQRELVAQNVALMQLTLPAVSSAAIAAIRSALDQEPRASVMSELRMRLLRDGISMRDADPFGAYAIYHKRRQRTREERGEHDG